MERIKSVLEKAIREGIFPGAVLLVSRGGGKVLLEAVGMAALIPEPVPMKRDTIFDLASLSKVCAASLAMMRLVDTGRVGLDDPLSALLPSADLGDKAGLTPRLLLTHSAGLVEWKPFYEKLIGYPLKERKRVLRGWIIREPFAYEPGMATRYSDLGFMLLHWVIEERTSLPLETFVHERFYRPLGLKRTFFRPTHPSLGIPGAKAGLEPGGEAGARGRPGVEEFAATEDCPWRKRVLRGEVHDENAFALGGCSTHAGLFSTAEEVHGIATMLREHYLGRRSDFFKPETVREFWRRQDLVEGSDWALGWDTRALEGSSAGRHFSRNSVGHTGFTGTSLWLDTEKDVMVILLTNRVHPRRESPEGIKAFRPEIHDAVMEEMGFQT